MRRGMAGCRRAAGGLLIWSSQGGRRCGRRARAARAGGQENGKWGGCQVAVKSPCPRRGLLQVRGWPLIGRGGELEWARTAAAAAMGVRAEAAPVWQCKGHRGRIAVEVDDVADGGRWTVDGDDNRRRRRSCMSCPGFSLASCTWTCTPGALPHARPPVPRRSPVAILDSRRSPLDARRAG